MPMPHRVEVIDEKPLLDGFLRVTSAQIRYERYDGQMSVPMTRLVMDRGDAAAVLLYDHARREVVLVQQFRYPAYRHEGAGWLWEIVAGVQEEGRTPEEVVRSESMEEAGYRLGPLRRVMTVYPSPGASSERVHIYLAPVGPKCRVGAGGGLEEGGEDILVRTIPLEEALRMTEDGRIVDAKTALALQYLARHWEEL